MKYIVLEEFIDKNTREIYETNQVINITKKRAKEIMSVGHLIEEVQED